MLPSPPKALTTVQNRYLMASMFTTGAIVLILEIVGTRVISPFYGSSIYCWSALITVTLVALAAGYQWGGSVADRGPSLTLFARLLSLAAACVALAPVMRSPVLRVTTGLGVELGTLASAVILFAPALVFLSMLGPLAIRLTTLGLDTVGRRSGHVYAVSTLGSVLGAVLAGFVLIPHLSTLQVFYGMAILLLLLSALGSWLSQIKIPLPQLAVAAAAILFGFWPRPIPKTNVLVNKESSYGQIKVLETGDKRYLLMNGTNQSFALLPDLKNGSQYAHSLELAPLLRPQSKNALVIGLGAGLLSTEWEKSYGLVVDSIEIDPDIVAVAKKYFGYAPRGQVFIEDGRTFVERAPKRYDIVVLDAFANEEPPYHLFTREAFTAIKARLKPGGIFAVNIASLVHSPGNEPWLAAYKTLQAVFPEVRAFIGDDIHEGIANVVIFSSEGSLADQKAASAVRSAAARDLKTMLAAPLLPDPEELAQVPLMSDDHAPMEFLMAQTARRWRPLLQRQIPDVLLY